MLVFDLLALFSLSSILVLCPVVLYRCEQVDPPWHEQMSWQWHRQKNKNKNKNVNGCNSGCKSGYNLVSFLKQCLPVLNTAIEEKGAFLFC